MDALFIIWDSPTNGSSRSREFAKVLEVESRYIFYPLKKRNALTAPLRYTVQAYQTLKLLWSRRPTLVFVQSPPGFAVISVYFYCALMGKRYIVDAHSGAFNLAIWKHPEWLYRLLARKALVTIVTNEYFQEIIMSWGANSLILRDPVIQYPTADYPLNGSFNLAVVNTFSKDEPLEEVLDAANELREVAFYITGKIGNASSTILEQAPPNVHFTDFLPHEQYYGLLKASDAVMCLTTHNHTLQCGAGEALSLGRPIITSDWPLLKEYFCLGTVHVPSTREGIRQGILDMKNHYELYLHGIKELQAKQRQEWKEKYEELLLMIQTGASSCKGYPDE